jgi:hypothetical protein
MPRRGWTPAARRINSNYWSRHGETHIGRAIWFPRAAPPARISTDSERDEKFASGSLQRRVVQTIGSSAAELSLSVSLQCAVSAGERRCLIAFSNWMAWSSRRKAPAL